MPSLPFFPLRRADITVLFVELQRVDHTQHFVDITTQRQIVYDLVANNTVSVNQERAAQRNAFVRVFDTVSFLNFTLHVGDHCVFHRANAAFIDRGCLRHAL
ncbi:Uncharacterised protein [Salmonella sp. NCTC 11881]|nr:Uncharacterised protein [Salmonella sp. NCTC 11881]